MIDRRIRITAAALLVEALLARKRFSDTRRALRRELAADRGSQD